MQRMFNAILGAVEIFRQEERILNGVLFFALLVSMSTLFGELLRPTGVYTRLFTLANFVAFLLMYLLGRRSPSYNKLLFPYFLFSFLIILWVWLLSGEINRIVLALSLSFLGITHVLTRGMVRNIVLILIVSMVGVMAVVDISIPEFLRDEELNPFRFMETLGAGTILVVGLTLFLSLVVYDQKERQRLAENRSRSREKFLSIIAHDLKGSVGSLVSLAELRMSMNGNQEQPDLRELDQIILDSSKSTYRLLENLLSWTRVQSGMMTCKPVPLSLKQVIDKNLGMHEEQSRQKKIGVQSEIHPDLKVLADEYMLDTVIRNLLSNAVKFTPPGGDILIKSCEGKQASTVCFSVSDSGVGIGEEHLVKIFDIDSKFRREGTVGEPGTGMGLKLCKEFLVLNRGNIRVDSHPGEGSVFTVSLPEAYADIP